MVARPSALATWSPEAVAQARRWVRTWQDAAPRLAEIRRRELRALDPYTTIALLCGPANYREAPRAPKPTSGLIEQQRLFARQRRR